MLYFIVFTVINIIFNIAYIIYINQGRVYNTARYKLAFSNLPWCVKIPKVCFYWLTVLYFKKYLPFIIRIVFWSTIGTIIWYLITEALGIVDFTKFTHIFVFVAAIPYGYAGTIVYEWYVFAKEQRIKRNKEQMQKGNHN